MTDNRSFFLDEANLARNVIEKTYPQFFASLDYDQYAPPLFLVESKLFVSVLGSYDYVFRLLPFICAVLSLFLLWRLVVKWQFSIASQIYTIGLFSLSELAIRYGTEFKQYSSDVLIALLLIWWASDEEDGQLTLPRMVFWTFVGSLVIWYSMPSVFILAGVGCYFLSRFKSKSNLRGLFVLGTVWLLSFGVYYLLILRQGISNASLQNFHDDYFVSLLPLNAQNYTANLDIVVSLFRSILDKTTLFIVFGMLLFSHGVYTCFNNSRSRFFLVGVPIIVVLAASSLRLYSLIPRMTLFIMPSFILLIGMGVDRFWNSSPLWKRALLGVLLLVSLVNKKGYQTLIHSLDYGDTKQMLQYLQDNILPSESVYVHHELVPSYYFYTELATDPYEVVGGYMGHWSEKELRDGYDYIMWGYPPDDKSSLLSQKYPDLACDILLETKRVGLHKCN